jgi:uncharacterized protein YjiS (DUF1127 family)
VPNAQRSATALHKRIADAFSLHSIFSRTGAIKIPTKQANHCTAHLFLEEKIMNPIRIAKSWINYRRTVAELGNLSNHALTDIGITRFDIRNIASRSFR